VQIVVPYTPGTGADIVARTLGPRLAERWNAGVIADNRPGATGNIGADFVAKSVADGHILLMTATSFCTTPALSAKLPFDPVKSFAPDIQIAASGTLVAHRNCRVKSMRDFIALSKPSRTTLLCALPALAAPAPDTGLTSSIPVSTSFMCPAGMAGALTDLMGGVCGDGSGIRRSPQVRAGRLRMLATMGEKRAAAFPDIATMRNKACRRWWSKPALRSLRACRHAGRVVAS
jgi:tripartite-type tricarboxylate transporter receptor subunit TctC